MADTVTVKAGVDYEPDATSERLFVKTEVLSKAITMTGTDFYTATQTIGTSEEGLTGATEMATPGYIMIKNLDSTNYVEFNADAGPTAYTIKLKAGEYCLFRMAHTQLKCIADTAAVQIQVWLFED